ncbi:hypothetical protein ACFWW0_42645, partial [Streptomyces violascens]
ALRRSHVYRAERVRSVRLTGLDEVNTLAYDGETAAAPDALLLDKADRALVVYSPAEPQDEIAQRARTATAAIAAGAKPLP